MKIEGNTLLIELENMNTAEDFRTIRRSLLSVLQRQIMSEAPMSDDEKLGQYIMIEILLDLEQEK